MSQTFDFYDARANESAAEAAAATLDNVRDKALRSEAAWRQLANRVLRMEAARRAADQARSDRLAEEKAAGADKAFGRPTGLNAS